MTLDALVPLLQCPVCREALAYTPVAQREEAAGECGVLRCSCATYPVVDGVPILTQERVDIKTISDATVLAEGPTPEAMIARVIDGEGLAALAELLTFPVCPWPLNRLESARALSLREPIHGAGLAARRAQTERRLRRRAELTAEDWLAAFYWHSPSVYDPFNYFLFRFSQPKHLATSGVLAALPPAERPLLDVACGYGHLLHAPATGGQAAIGVDQNFHQVWVARHYVAPGAAFVCADADRPLPFADGAGSAAFVSDAFQYFRRKGELLDELRRATGDGPLVLASTGNATVEPSEEQELTPDAYAALLDAHAGPGAWLVVTEADLVDRYLAGVLPDLSHSSTEADVAAARFLTYVIPGDAPLASVPADLPHTVGTLRLNPLYLPEGNHVRFEMPSPWFGIENGAMRAYMPALADWPAEVVAAVTRGEQTPEVQTLLRRLVIIGVPARYARASRPVTQRADRRLSQSIGTLKRGLRRVVTAVALG